MRRIASALALTLAGAAFAAPPAGTQAAGAGAPAQDHAERARLLEELGKTAAAAREYEAAYSERREPELLYRLALCRRALGDYAAAREALRGYLREAPGGPLRDEVERQLAQLAVLIEARGIETREQPKLRVAAKPQKERPGAIAAGHPAPAKSPASAAPAPASRTTPAPQSAPSTIAAAPTPLAPVLDSPMPAPTPPAPAAPSPETPAMRAAAALAELPAPAASGPAPGSAPGIVSNQHQVPVPAPALELRAPAVAPRLHPAVPWLAGGALALGAAGTVLCVGAHEIASDLDARFSAGALTTADLPRYSKERAEAIAGTAMIGAALVALGAAGVLAW